MGRNNAIGRARAAARALERAFVDLGPDRAQLCSFFSEVRGRGDESVLVLEPIAGDSLPLRAAGPITVRCDRDEAGFELVCSSIARVSATRAEVALRDARLIDAREKHIAYCVTGRRPLVLAVADGLREGDGHVFPIVEISAEGCVIDAAIPLPPGREVARVEVANDRVVLRRASAAVSQVSPWCTSDGSRRFRCTLRFLPVSQLEPTATGDVIAEPLRVRRILQLAALSGAAGIYDAPIWGQGELRFVDHGDDTLRLELAQDLPASDDPRYIEVRFELFSATYEVTLRVLERSRDSLLTAMPLHARRARSLQRDRRIGRAGPRALSLVFRNPITGKREERRICDLSLHDVFFDAATPNDLLWQDLPLDHAFISDGARRIVLGTLRIESVGHEGGESIARASIDRSTGGASHDLVGLVAMLDHPHVRVHDGTNFTSMLAIYKEAGLFAPHMRRNLDPIMPAAKRVWHFLHRADAALVTTLQHDSDGAPDGAVTAVRPWEHAFVAQHFVSVKARSATAAGRLQLAYVDYVQSRPEAHHLVFFVKSDNKQMNAFYERFFATTGTPEAIERRTVSLFCRLGTSRAVPVPRALVSAEVQAMRRAQEALISRAAERRLGAQGAAALSFLPGEFRLPEVSRGFAKVGLTRARICEAISRGGDPVYAMIEEITSPGFNFTWMLNATWILPVHTDLDPTGDVLRSALTHVLSREPQTPTGDRFLNVVEGVDADVLAEAGFEKLADTYMYTMNRAGLNRYFHYASDRYGEVGARTQQREARRSAADQTGTHRLDPTGTTRRAV